MKKNSSIWIVKSGLENSDIHIFSSLKNAENFINETDLQVEPFEGSIY